MISISSFLEKILSVVDELLLLTDVFKTLPVEEMLDIEVLVEIDEFAALDDILETEEVENDLVCISVQKFI